MKSIATLVTLLLVLSFASVASAEWQGQEAEKDGVRYVINPETPMEEIRIELEELWERGGDDDDIFFGRLSQIVHDADGNLYVLDSQLSEIHVFSPSGEYLNTIGGEGEGPGEFSAASDLYMGPDGLLGIVRVFPGRVFRLGIDGGPAEFLKLPEDDGGFRLVYVGRANSERIVLAGAKNGRSEQVKNLKAYGPEGNELAHFVDITQPMRFGGHTFEEERFSDFSRRWALADDGRVAVAMDFDAYTIDIYNKDGSLAFKIDRPDHKPLDRTDKEKARFQAFFDGMTRWSPNSTFNIKDHHSAVSRVWFRGNTLWVLSNRDRWQPGDGVFASIDEYDEKGRYTRKIDLAVDGDAVEDGIYFLDDRMYRVTDLFSAIMAALGGDSEDASESDAEPLRVVAYRLDDTAIGMK